MLFHPEQNHDGWSQERTGIDYVMIYIHPELFLELIQKKDIVRFQSPIVYHAGLRKSILDVTRSIFTGQLRLEAASCFWVWQGILTRVF